MAVEPDWNFERALEIFFQVLLEGGRRQPGGGDSSDPSKWPSDQSIKSKKRSLSRKFDSSPN